MSMDLYVCWGGDLPMDRPKLKEALAAAGFDATILHDFVDASGYWPVDIDGLRAGVEVYFDADLDELKEFYPVLSEALGPWDKGLTFTFGGDWAEGGMACALAAALAHLGDVVIYEPSEGVVWSADRAAAEARRSFGNARKEGYRERPPDQEQE